MKGLFTFFLSLFFIPAFAQNVKTVTAVYDSTALLELYDRMPIGLKLIYDNGLVRQTEGFLGGNYRWNRIKVSTSNGTFQNGYILLDRKKLVEEQYKVNLSVSIDQLSQVVTLVVPHVEKIRFNHYADSLKRDIHFYLNVEGEFSSGKVFPLDTSSIKFEVSTGKMIGQDLLLDLKDTTTRVITVNAVYKNDPQINAVTNIPVKQLPDDESKILPNNYNKRH
jgi:hypothetical protein